MTDKTKLPETVQTTDQKVAGEPRIARARIHIDRDLETGAGEVIGDDGVKELLTSP